MEEEIIEDTSDNEKSDAKMQKLDEQLGKKVEATDPLIESASQLINQKASTSINNKTQRWNKSVGVISRKNALSGLVKVNKKQETVTSTNQNLDNESNINNLDENKISELKNKTENTKPIENTNGLSLLGAYSDSDSNESE